MYKQAGIKQGFYRLQGLEFRMLGLRGMTPLSSSELDFACQDMKLGLVQTAGVLDGFAYTLCAGRATRFLCCCVWQWNRLMVTFVEVLRLRHMVFYKKRGSWDPNSGSPIGRGGRDELCHLHSNVSDPPPPQHNSTFHEV